MPSQHVSTFAAPDGTVLAYRDVGAGHPVILLHGFVATGAMWSDAGITDRFVQQGFRVILPDLRGHGASARPHAAPADVLAADGLALIDALGLETYALGGYSLGARVAVRMLVRGARPTRALLGGQGMEQVRGSRGDRYRPMLTALAEGRAGDDGAAEWLRRSGNDPRALLAVLDTLVPTTPSELGAVPTESLVVLGAGDERRASGPALAQSLGDARYIEVPGDHAGALATPEFGEVAVDFLSPGPSSSGSDGA
ncbi:alpha/beta fold hydrolase [Tsukamurella soli]|uniref:Alpha/beta fold hydrolase n=1 Tax=Tsukamurella soli TaxID=644556 RepID=A0ABP8KE33_9ACTN